MSHTDIRLPAVAGLFYPNDPVALGAQVMQYLQGATVDRTDAKAIIAPHAGYVYSGAIAGTAYASIRHLAPQVHRIVLAGPAHRYPFEGIAVPSARALATPLGFVSVDRAALDALVDGRDIRVIDRAFDGEHGLEVHLPFIQCVFDDVAVVPLLVGQATPELVHRTFARLWGGPETFFIISSDLSHFHDYRTARKLDLSTSQSIEAIQGKGLNGTAACGHLPIAGLLGQAQRLDLRSTTHDLRNSGDTAGPRDRVVGYGAYTFEDAAKAHLTAEQRDLLHDVARRALCHAARADTPWLPAPEDYPYPLRAVRKSFVTLEAQGQLRGCIGTVEAAHPLVQDIALNTWKAARQDPRFPPVRAEEVDGITLALSILSHPVPLSFASEAELRSLLRPGVDGLILSANGGRRGLFLPKVWSMLPEPAQFLTQLKAKAGLPASYWGTDVQIRRFTTESF